MATHTAVVTKSELLASGAISFHGRCCGDPASDSPLTLYVDGATTDEAIDQKVRAHLCSVEARHASMQRVQAVLARYAAPAAPALSGEVKK